MSIVHTYDLDIVPGGVGVVVPLSQYDSDFQLVFNLFASTGTFTIESGTTATIRGTKLDGTGFSQDVSLNYQEKKVTVSGSNEILQQMTAVAGDQTFELTLWKSGKQLNTANFTLRVERAALDKDTPNSESVLRELVEILDKTDQIIAAGAQYESAEATIRELAEQVSTDATAARTAKETAEGLVSALNTKHETAMAEIDNEYKETIALIKGVARETKDYLDAHFGELTTDYNIKMALLRSDLETALENLNQTSNTNKNALESL